MEWLEQLQYDPVRPLLDSDNKAIVYFAQKDLLDQTKKEDELWSLATAAKILNKQQPNGSWKYPGGNSQIRSRTSYDQLETYRQLGFLVEKFNFSLHHPAIHKAAEFLFSFQSDEGDIRGIYGNQYSPNYSAGIIELLIKAGYKDDRRVKKCLDWLLSIRQNDGGWVIAFRTLDLNLDAITTKETLQSDRTKPSSWLITGVVLRALSQHSDYRHRNETKRAGDLLMSYFFKKDNYPDRGGVDFWTKFAFPFWFTDLNSSLDALGRVGFGVKEASIQRALSWLADHQKSDGLFNVKLLKTGDHDLKQWMTLSICRTIKQLC